MPTQVYSITSYKELRRDALDCNRHNMLNPGKEERIPYVTQLLMEEDSDFESIVVAVSDYVKAVPDSITPWVPGLMTSLGTDGFGRSETREALRDFFEVDARYIVLATLSSLYQHYELDLEVIEQAMRDLGIKADKLDPTKA